MTLVPRRTAILIVLALLPLVVACGGSSNGGGDNGGSSCNPPFSLGVSGTWFYVEQVIDNECQTTGVHQGSVLVAQSDELLTFFGDDTTWQMVLCGSRATNTSSFSAPSNGGLHTVTKMLIQFSSETSATGSTTWNWKNASGMTCSGTSTFNLSK